MKLKEILEKLVYVVETDERLKEYQQEQGQYALSQIRKELEEIYDRSFEQFKKNLDKFCEEE